MLSKTLANFYERCIVGVLFNRTVMEVEDVVQWYDSRSATAECASYGGTVWMHGVLGLTQSYSSDSPE